VRLPNEQREARHCPRLRQASSPEPNRFNGLHRRGSAARLGVGAATSTTSANDEAALLDCRSTCLGSSMKV
jgi:hypothetical protein